MVGTLGTRIPRTVVRVVREVFVDPLRCRGSTRGSTLVTLATLATLGSRGILVLVRDRPDPVSAAPDRQV